MTFIAILLGSLLAVQPQPAGGPAPVNVCDSLMIQQVRSAITKARACRQAHRGDLRVPITATYAGTASIEGHLMRPGMLRTMPVTLELVIDPAGSGVSVRETVGKAETASVETTLISGKRAAVQPAVGKPFVESTPEVVASSEWWSPLRVADAMVAAASSCRAATAMVSQGIEFSPISFTDGAGRTCTAFMDAGHRLCRVELLRADQRLGDVCEWVTFDDWAVHEAASIPRRVSRFVVQGALTVRYDLALGAVSSEMRVEAVGALPPEHQADVPGWALTPSPPVLEFVPLAPDVWAVESSAANVRVLAIEREKDIVVLGAPDGDAVSGEFIRGIRQRLADKPIGLVAFGHHHPSPSGGLRAWAAAGAAIIAPRGLESHVQHLLSRPTSLGAPAISAPTSTRIDYFDDRTTIDCGHTTVELLDIKERSDHAFHYVVFYLPDSGILFEDDLGYFPTTGVTRVSSRLVGLADALDEAGIVPNRIVQLWPVKDVARDVEWATIVELVKAAREKQSK